MQNFPFLRGLKLATIISLTPEVDENLGEFADANNIAIINIKVERAFDNITLNHVHVLAILNATIDPSNHPCLLHCFDGSESTGLAMMCLRKLQKYTSKFAIAEFERHRRAGSDAFSQAELKFVEAFRSRVALPEVLPSWLWGGNAEAYSTEGALPAATSPSSGRTGGRHGRMAGSSTSTPSEGGAGARTSIADGALQASIEALALEPGALRA